MTTGNSQLGIQGLEKSLISSKSKHILIEGITPIFVAQNYMSVDSVCYIVQCLCHMLINKGESFGHLLK